MGKKSRKLLNLDTIQLDSTTHLTAIHNQYNKSLTFLQKWSREAFVFNPGNHQSAKTLESHLRDLRKLISNMEAFHSRIVEHVSFPTPTPVSTKAVCDQSVQTDTPLLPWLCCVATQTDLPEPPAASMDCDLPSPEPVAPVAPAAPVEPVSAAPTASDTASGGTTVPAASSRPRRSRAKQQPTPKQVARSLRLFQEPDPDAPSGFVYVYVSWAGSQRLSRAAIRGHLRTGVAIDTGRILDISFPARGVMGLLVHAQYAPLLTAKFRAPGIRVLSDFDPLNPDHLLDPKFADLPASGRSAAAAQVQATRCLAALRRLRVELMPAVAHSFVRSGWITEEDLRSLLSEHKSSAAPSAVKKRKLADLFGPLSPDVDITSVMSH